MKVCIAAAAKSGSTAVYNSIKAAISAQAQCNSIFEPQRVYPILRLKNYDFSGNFVTKIMVSRMVSEKSDFHFGWFDKRIVLVRDVKDLLVSELLFRPMISPLEVDASALKEFVALIREKEANPQSWSLIDLHRRADELGISSINWEIFRKNLGKLAQLEETYACSVVHYEDFARGDYSGIRQVLGLPVGPASLEGSWVSHIQRKGQSGDWLTWFTPKDVEFVSDFFSEYCEHFFYTVPTDYEANTSPIPAQYGSDYIERKYNARVAQIKYLQESGGVDGEDKWEVLISRARDGGVEQIDRVIELKKEGKIPNGLIKPGEIESLKMFRNIIA